MLDSQMQQYQNLPQMCFVLCPQGMPFQNMLPFQLPLGMQVAPPVACQVPPPPPSICGQRQQHVTSITPRILQLAMRTSGQCRLATLISSFHPDLPHKAGHPHPPHPLFHGFFDTMPDSRHGPARPRRPARTPFGRPTSAAVKPTPPPHHRTAPLCMSPHPSITIPGLGGHQPSHRGTPCIPAPGPPIATRPARPSGIIWPAVRHPSVFDSDPTWPALTSSSTRLPLDFKVLYVGIHLKKGGVTEARLNHCNSLRRTLWSEADIPLIIPLRASERGI